MKKIKDIKKEKPFSEYTPAEKTKIFAEARKVSDRMFKDSLKYLGEAQKRGDDIY